MSSISSASSRYLSSTAPSATVSARVFDSQNFLSAFAWAGTLSRIEARVRVDDLVEALDDLVDAVILFFKKTCQTA
jgi:hypothetical protein